MSTFQQLEGITVAIPEARYGHEFAALFQRAGARVRLCPLAKETVLEDQSSTRAFIDLAVSSRLDMAIFMTGIGVNLIVQHAETAGLRDGLVNALGKMIIVSRGSKSTASLRRANVRIDIIPPAATSEGVAEAVAAHDLHGKHVAVQLYGTPNPLLVSYLESRGASVYPVSVYTYQPASDPENVETFIREIVNQDIQIVAFTSAAQVRVLFEAAATLGLAAALQGILTTNVQVASIGEVTTGALKAHHVQPHIIPLQPKMGPMVDAVIKAVCITRLS